MSDSLWDKCKKLIESGVSPKTVADYAKAYREHDVANHIIHSIPPWVSDPSSQLGAPTQSYPTHIPLSAGGFNNMPASPPKGMTITPERAMEMIRMRMRWEGYYDGFIYINAIVCEKKAMVIVIDKQENHVVLEDEPGLFPSDALITSLRLLAPK